MNTNKKLLTMAITSLFISNSYATYNYSFSGTLSDVNAVQVFNFGLEYETSVELITYSYAGGRNFEETNISSGGFNPVVSIVGSNGIIIATDNDSRGVIDQSTGYAYDAQLLQTLDAGEYQALVSMNSNIPTIGKSVDEQDTFPGGGDIDERTYNYALDILNVEFASLGKEFIVFTMAEEEQEAVIKNTSKSALKSQTINSIKVIRSHFRDLRTPVSGEFSVKNASYSPESGINAGDGVSGLAMWLTTNYSHLNNTQSINHNKRYEEEDTSYLAGVDYIVNTNIVVGGMLGYEKSTADLNDGSDTEKDGVVMSVYGAYNVSDSATLYALGGYGDLDNNINNLIGSTVIKGDFDSNKLFFSLGGLYYSQYNGYNLTLEGSYNWAREDIDSYTNSVGSKIKPGDTELRLLSASLEVAKPYSWGEIFVSGGMEIDVSPSLNDVLLEDDNGMGGIVGGGIRFNNSDNFFAELTAGYNVFHKYEHGGHTISATLRYEF